MATVSFCFASSSGRVHGLEQQQHQQPDKLRGRTRASSKHPAGRTNWMEGSGSCCKLDIRVRLKSRSCAGGEPCIPVLPLRSTAGRISASSRLDDEAEIDGGGGEMSSLEDEDARKEVQIDLQLPRRRLLVEFTCNVCQTRTQRLVNPEAYKRGTVYVQCSGCEAYHKLVDNLGLVVEYDFRKDPDAKSS